MKALLTAGAPSSTGHDEERMLRALREIMDHAGRVPMRIGVNTGKVFTGDFGPPYRRAYRVFGDAINTAARVMSKADAGQILSTEIVLERSRTAFETTPIEPFAPRGRRSRPGLGRRPGGRAARVCMTETPLVGRERELAALLESSSEASEIDGLDRRDQRRPGARAVAARPGADRARRDVSVLHTRCEEYEASTPYFPLRLRCRALLGLEPARDSASCRSSACAT